MVINDTFFSVINLPKVKPLLILEQKQNITKGLITKSIMYYRHGVHMIPIAQMIRKLTNDNYA